MVGLQLSEIVERVARAIEATMFASHELPITGELHERYLEAARAAIAAMADPTNDMLAAGKVALSLGANALGVWSHMHGFATNKFPNAEKVLRNDRPY